MGGLVWWANWIFVKRHQTDYSDIVWLVLTPCVVTLRRRQVKISNSAVDHTFIIQGRHANATLHMLVMLTAVTCIIY